MGDTQLVADGEDRTTLRPLRPAAPIDGPLAGSGAGPEPATRLPRPRRPWLKFGASAAGTSAEAGAPAAGPAPAGPAKTPAGSSTPEPPEAGPTPTPTAAAKPGDTDKPAAAKPDDESATEPKPGDTPAAEPKPGDTRALEPKPDDTPAAEPKPDDTPAAEPKPDDTPATAGKPDDTPTTDAKPGDRPATTAKPDDLTETKVDAPATKPATGPRRRRVQFAHAVRQPPHRVAMAAARATRDWSRRPSGRLTLPGVFLLALVAATATAGALLVPATARGPRPVAADATSATPTTAPQVPLPGGLPLPNQTVPPPGTVPTGPPGGGITGRPSDALAGWAAQIGPKVGISPVAMQAYGYAELVLSQTNRSCGLSWTTLAAIGFVESGHGQANNAKLGQDGKALPEIIGLPLDGQGGRMRIPDTDRGLLDKDPVLDRAVGPMQFIPTTWQEIGADADNDGVKDPHDLDDAALAAGNYLCKGGRNLTIPADWWSAILSYNDVRRYAQDVHDTANRYGQASRT
ncbi:lytic murein transglycosylase [Micromonospora peucetia]|uniref:Lytic murein transglycosylase n=1 Tax=Micromonospora peucetia TaxID=47871 RepID=A0A1C6V768_9ACTN|nr:lytic murein transglycosylase [Micromonospora peucetia]MCX4389315.1 lytic murein transglycosylase [Micromonospora peucetia]WSA35497.1 lytic murein transglycosylase [Micromonospora peucetia]SCL62189.1 Membrane-bound lytic murein transglycosylase B [Micromonospora peucetia]